MNRLHQLDYLRGLSAVGIMFYHLLSWSSGDFESENMMGRIGIYGVDLFFVVSGLTLFHVYFPKMQPTRSELITYCKKRIARIFPLLWLGTIAGVLLSMKVPDLTALFLNLTGLFSVFRWNIYFVTGAWSIGNELVFYVCFPVFVLLSKHFKSWLFFAFLLAVTLFLAFAFYLITPAETLSDQWKIYIHPLNSLLFFLGGFLLGLGFENLKISNGTAILSLLSGLLIFIFYPVTGDLVNIISGANRLLFSLATFLIVFGFYKAELHLPHILHKSLGLLGQMSYSVYLLHPLVYDGVRTFAGTALINWNNTLRLGLLVVISLVLSYFVYRYFERYFIKKAAGPLKN